MSAPTISTWRFYQAVAPDSGTCEHRKGQPLNHIGIQVDNLEEIEKRAVAFGLKPFSHDDYAPGRRFYILDRDGIEYEIVSYAEGASA